MIRIEPFDKATHRRTGFQCGNPGLDEFIWTLVSQYEKRRLGKTFVAVRTGEPDTVVGYYTLAAGAVAYAHVPEEVARRLPKHPLPVILLARLAVDRSAQGQGVGAALLRDALRRSLGLSNSLGVFAVEVLAVGGRAAAFYGKYGFTPLLDDPRHMYLPIQAVDAAVLASDPELETE